MTQPQVDAQFDRAVQIVQGVSKTRGPIQISYEDKLLMYRCVKHDHSWYMAADALSTHAACISKVHLVCYQTNVLGAYGAICSYGRERTRAATRDVGHARAC
jgi:aspartokinase-like uncharacterized kinase